ncbi:hypothetical protein D3C85_1711230 [compost metagenome]
MRLEAEMCEPFQPTTGLKLTRNDFRDPWDVLHRPHLRSEVINDAEEILDVL